MDNIKNFEDFLDRMQGLLDSAKKQGHIIVRVEDLENTFPELKESEDEKIRRAIHIYLDWLDGRKDYAPKGKYTIKDMISWLKKHGEPVEINPTEFDTRLQALIGKFDSLPKEELIGSLSFWLNVVQNDGTYKIDEKQDEQKPYGQRKECEDCQFSYVGECKGDCALKRNEQKSADKVKDEEYNGEDYGIDSLFHAQRILEKTLGKVDGYQTDDGILAHQCAISAVKKLYEQKPVSVTDEWIEDYWQHEKVNNPYSYDKGEEIQFDHQGFIRFCKKYCKKPAEWSEEDIRNIENIDSVLFYDKDLPEDTCVRLRNWLKSLKPQNHWKPTEEQIRALHDLNLTGNISYAGQGQVLIELYNDLYKISNVKDK